MNASNNALLFLLFFVTAVLSAITDPDMYFNQVNEEFHQQYRSFASQMKHDFNPQIHQLYLANVVIADLFEDSIKMQTTRSGDQMCSMQQSMSNYAFNELKTISHYPVAVYLYLLSSSRPNSTSIPLSIEFPSKFVDGHSIVINDKVFNTLQTVYLPMVRNLKSIVSNTTCINTILNHIQQVLQNELLLHSKWSIQTLENKFTTRLNRALKECSNLAAKEQIQWMDQVLRDWMAKCGISWNTISQRTTFIIKGGKMPRRQNLQYQFFKKLIKTSSKFDKFKLIYAENIKTDEEALQIAVNSIQDSILSMAFFQKQGTLHKDILSEGAQKHLKNYFKKLK